MTEAKPCWFGLHNWTTTGRIHIEHFRMFSKVDEFIPLEQCADCGKQRPSPAFVAYLTGARIG